MTLFFETSGQAAVFLATLPIGFVLALGIDLIGGAGRFRLLLDACFVTTCGLALTFSSLVFRTAALRGYHLLALLAGALLYICGFRHAWCMLGKKLEKFFQIYCFSSRKTQSCVENITQ